MESAEMIGEEVARADSYLIEDGKIVAQTIHYTMEDKQS
jgi:hypothetical protein